MFWSDMTECAWTSEMNEATLVSVVALLAWLFLISNSGVLRNMAAKRKLAVAAFWAVAFLMLAFMFDTLN